MAANYLRAREHTQRNWFTKSSQSQRQKMIYLLFAVKFGPLLYLLSTSYVPGRQWGRGPYLWPKLWPWAWPKLNQNQTILCADNPRVTVLLAYARSVSPRLIMGNPPLISTPTKLRKSTNYKQCVNCLDYRIKIHCYSIIGWRACKDLDLYHLVILAIGSELKLIKCIKIVFAVCYIVQDYTRISFIIFYTSLESREFLYQISLLYR